MDKKDRDSGQVKIGVVIKQAKEGYQPKPNPGLKEHGYQPSGAEKVEKGFQPKPTGGNTQQGKPPSGGSNVAPPKKSGS